jgi:hypothetical protein
LGVLVYGEPVAAGAHIEADPGVLRRAKHEHSARLLDVLLMGQATSEDVVYVMRFSEAQIGGP